MNQLDETVTPALRLNRNTGTSVEPNGTLVYVGEAELESPDEVVPDEFVRWIFPALVAHRRPKYEALAEQHGYTLNARLAESIANERDFLELVSNALD